MANLIGQTLLEQFRVDQFIASGGMGSVYSVWDLKRQTQLAMKVLHGDLAEESSIFKRFEREAIALKKLAHPHIVPFYGLHQTMGLVFMLQRFVDGPTLGDILRARKRAPLPIDDVLVYFKAMCSALGYAHTMGVIHCDVKPGNVMTDHSGGIYLTDFGIARYSDSTATSLANAGTPAYMAPEQIRGERVSAATDVYALGIILFECMTGQRPFTGKEPATERGGNTISERVRFGQLHVAPPDPRSINSDISEGISSVMLRALQKDPKHRFRSTQDFFSALCQASGLAADDIPDRVGRSTPSKPVRQPPQPVTTVAIPQPQTHPEEPKPPSEPPPQPSMRQPQNSRFLLVGIGGVVILLLVWLGFRVGAGSMVVVFDSATSTPTVTATAIPPTRTATRTPSPTLIPSATPVIVWSDPSVVDSGNSRPGPFVSAGVGASGKYYVAYFREGLDKIMVMEGNGTSWKQSNNVNQINGEGRSVGVYVNLNINQAGLPYLVYQVRSKARNKEGTPKSAMFTGSGKWNIATIGQALDVYDLRAAFDSTGTAHHAVLTKSGDVLYAANGSALETVETGAMPPSAATVRHNYFPLAMAVDVSQQPMICFSKSGRIQCRHKVGNLWNAVNVPGSGSHPSIQYDQDGNLHLAYFDQQSDVLKYAILANSSSSWKTDTVERAPSTGLYPSLMVDSNGLVHISYYDQGNSALKYALGRFGGWSTYEVDNDGDVGLISSLMLDAQNNPAIAYYDPGQSPIEARVKFITRKLE